MSLFEQSLRLFNLKNNCYLNYNFLYYKSISLSSCFMTVKVLSLKLQLLSLGFKVIVECILSFLLIF